MLHFINSKTEILSISYDASYVIYNELKYSTKFIHLFSEKIIKLTFSDFIIKYSKDELNLYKINDHIKLIDTFIKFNGIVNIF
jgi:hypothetical protein